MFYLLDQPTEREFEALAGRYQEMAPLAVKATVSLLKVGSDLLTGFENMLGRYNLSQGRFLVLMVMNRKPEELTSPSILSKKIGVTRATMTRLIDRLVQDGLILRHPHKNDRRKQDLSLTEKGQEVLEGVLPDYWTRIDALMAGLDESEQRNMIMLLTKVAKGIPALTQKVNDERLL